MCYGHSEFLGICRPLGHVRYYPAEFIISLQVAWGAVAVTLHLKSIFNIDLKYYLD